MGEAQPRDPSGNAEAKRAFATCIVPLDFSRPSDSALRWGGFLSRFGHLRLVAVHAVAPIALVEVDGAAAELSDAVVSRMEELLDPLARQGVQAEAACAFSGASDAILREASRVDRPLVVMGNRGLSRVRRVFLGSVADEVVRTADCPVLVVHEDDDTPSLPTGGVQSVFRVVIGVDFSEGSGAALAAFRAVAAVLLRAGIRVEATLLAVLQQPQFIDGMDAPLLRTGDFGALEESTLDRLRPVAQSMRIDGIEPRMLVLHGDAAMRILGHCREEAADLIVVGRRAQGALSRILLGSTAERILHGSRVPVLTAQARRLPRLPVPSRSARARIISCA